MTGFNHTLAGAIIAIATPSPFQPLLAFLSHYVLDATPHFGRDSRFVPYNKAFLRLLTVDAVLCFAALGFAIALFPNRWWLLIICTAAATLPDFMWALRKWSPAWLRPQFTLHHKIQWGERPYGWIFELLYALIGVVVLLALAR